MAAEKFPDNLLDKKFIRYVSTIVNGVNIRLDGHYCHILHSLDNKEYAAYEACYKADVPTHNVIAEYIKAHYEHKGK